MEEYAKEFIKLAKFVPYSVSTETARIERFKAGLITPLYKAIVSTEFSSLTSLIDQAKHLKAKEIEEKAEREQRKKAMRKFQGGQSRGGAVTIEPAGYPTAPIPHRNKKKWRGQYRDVPAQPILAVSVAYGAG